MSLDLYAIRARVEAAEPGPWSVLEPPPRLHNQYSPTVYVESEPLGEMGHVADVIAWGGSADFIAHAREDVPALIAEVERLREMLHVIRVTGPERESALASEALA